MKTKAILSITLAILLAFLGLYEFTTQGNYNSSCISILLAILVMHNFRINYLKTRIEKLEEK